MKEPARIVYKDGNSKSIVSVNASSDRFANSDTGNDGEKGDDLLDRNGAEGEFEGKDKPKIDSISSGGEGLQWRLRQITGREPNGHSLSQKAADMKVRELKDQLIKARVYLSLAPPNSNSHLVKELKLRIKEVERAVGRATKDSALSRKALQKMRSMELTLSKASQVYPDTTAMATKLRAMIHNTEEQVQAQKNQATYLVKLAAMTFPKGLHCLSMRLTTDYYSLQPQERQFPNGQKLHQLDLYHYALFSDNVIACAVVVNSTIMKAREPDKIVFHIATDSLNLPAMRMWFLANPPEPATVAVESMDDFKWLPHGYISLSKQLNSQDPRYASKLNHLRFYLPEIFPKLDKVILLDHDVVVQRDLSALWTVDLKGKVNGAVETCRDSKSSYRMDMFVNFSDPTIAKSFDVNTCTWAFGMNVFDLREWRRQDLTAVYHKWLQLGARRQLFKAGSLPVAQVVFYNLTLALDRRWHAHGLGYDPALSQREIERAAVIHYDGNMKPWLEIGIIKYRGYWNRFVKYDHPYLQQCNIHE